MYLCHKTKQGLGGWTCVYKVTVTWNKHRTPAFTAERALHGGFLLPLQNVKEYNSLFSPVVLVLEDQILETRDPETWDPEIQSLVTQDPEAVLAKKEVDIFF